jgi:hypothetical protein
MVAKAEKCEKRGKTKRRDEEPKKGVEKVLPSQKLFT